MPELKQIDVRSFAARIAAVAVASGLALFTCNPDAYVTIDGRRLPVN
jgi:hypothetical protein